MFTGIVEDRGRVLKIEFRGGAKRLFIELPFDLTEIRLGDSINIDGVCLTAVEKKGQVVELDLSPETIERTTLGNLKEGDEVNIERALRPIDRLGGHIVTGHIDGIGNITEKRWEGRFLNLKIRIPNQLIKYIVPKGSIAIDGVSLTVNEIEGNEIKLAIIPFTIAKTTLGDKKVGDKVNLETDILAKYVESLISQKGQTPKGLTLSFLKEHGYIKEE
jgi:riboflavin synthase